MDKSNWFIVFALVAIGSVWAYGAQIKHVERISNDMARPPIPATGAATTIDCSAAASASSAALTVDTCYMISCTDDSYLRWGTSAPTAAAGDMILGSGDWLEFCTPSTDFYVACKNVNNDKACYYLEAR